MADKKAAPLEVVHPDCAGIDVGKRKHYVAVDPSRFEDPVRNFGTFTGDLEAMAEWLGACGVRQVAMESTGGVLDPGVRGARPGGFRGAPGEPAGDQAGERAQERRAGLPMDPATHELRAVAGCVPGAGRAVSDALLCAPARPTHPRPQPLGATHTKGADANERAVGQRA